MAQNIRYICLSDLHLGEEDSLLTNLGECGNVPDPGKPSPVMLHLVECLEHLIGQINPRKKPVLILAGDILELALTTVNQAAMVFERFIELTMSPGRELFKDILYIPGNHDHHFWENARELEYARHVAKLRPGRHLPLPWHVSRMFARKLSKLPQAHFLTTLLQRHPGLAEREFEVNVAYPNFGLLSKDSQSCVIFHHGHFIESLYKLMSHIKTLIFPDREMPSHAWDLEEENFAWIDFFWSSMGRSGEFGQDVELIYEKMRDQREFHELLSGLAGRLGDQYDLPGWDWLTVRLIEGVLHGAADRARATERNFKEGPLSMTGRSGLEEYLHRPLRAQILRERKGNMPLDVTFVFGHTHKPFQEIMRIKGYRKHVKVYNTGGWVIDTVAPEPVHGASVLLLDENLNVAAIRMYNQAAGPEDYAVDVAEARPVKKPDNPFHRKIRERVRPSEEPWKSFSKSVAAEIRLRADNLRERIRTD